MDKKEVMKSMAKNVVRFREMNNLLYEVFEELLVFFEKTAFSSKKHTILRNPGFEGVCLEQNILLLKEASPRVSINYLVHKKRNPIKTDHGNCF